MECVRVTSEYGIVVRLASLKERGIPLDKLLVALEASTPFDRNDELATFGPHFGGEALDTFVRRLSDLGLKYFDDFFEFSGDFPKWCTFKLAAASETPDSSERPTDREIEAAARVLSKEAHRHHWWPTNAKSYDEIAAADPIGKSEFEGIVERILMAASRARLDAE